MSGIAALLQVERRAGDGLAAMMATLAHRGPEGVATFRDGPISLGLAHSATANGGGGIVSRGGLTIVADLRLDNRDALLSALGCAPVSDAELVLRGFEKWREDVVHHLDGEFALAIWDANTRQVFSARDHFGVKPLFFAAARDRIAIASERKALLAIGFGECIDETAIANYLAGAPDAETQTLYADIKRVPAAYTLTVHPGVTLSRYWRLEPEANASPDPEAEFRALLAGAVQRRLATPLKCGAMLSGGLDSSAIVCLAAQNAPTLQTFSLVPKREPGERAYIEAVREKAGCQTHFSEIDDGAPLDAFEALLEEQDGLFAAPNLIVSQGAYARAAEAGVRVLLDGHGGDEAVSYGNGALRDLAIARRWRRLWREVRAANSARDSVATFAAYAEAFHPLLAGPRRLRRGVARRLGAGRSAHGATPIIHPELAQRAGVKDRIAEAKAAQRSACARPEAERHVAAFNAMPHAQAFEVLDHCAAHAGVESRYPFYDRKLVQFCTGLASDWKLRNGLPRWILRSALQDILPDAVRLRRDKFDFSGNLAARLMTHHGALLRQLCTDKQHPIGHFVDQAALSVHVETLAAGQAKDASALLPVWRAATLAVWLRRTRYTLLKNAA